jgi:hypothetical protein
MMGHHLPDDLISGRSLMASPGPISVPPAGHHEMKIVMDEIHTLHNRVDEVSKEKDCAESEVKFLRSRNADMETEMASLREGFRSARSRSRRRRVAFKDSMLRVAQQREIDASTLEAQARVLRDEAARIRAESDAI